MSTLHHALLAIASELPEGDAIRRELLESLRQAGGIDIEASVEETPVTQKTSMFDQVVRMAADLPKGSDLRRQLLAMAKESYGRMPVMPRESYLPKEVRGKKPLVPEGTDLAIYTWEENGVPYGIAFAGKAKKPLWNYRFRNEAQRDQQIRETTDNRRSHIRRMQERAEERRQFQHGLQIGDILYSSWGYDQTNIDFYEVTKLVGKMVEVRKVAQKVTKSEVGADYVVPVPGRYVGPPLKKKPQGSGGRVYIKITSFAHASPWDGKPKYQTALGWGH